jgi:hypothetical protein
MMFFLALLPGMFLRCCAKASGLGGEGQYMGSVKRCQTVIASEAKQSSFALAPKVDCFVAVAPRNDGAYTDAVVTPPSTTMVWPVMKLEASEER